jgi:hypothetical protein
MELPEDVLLLVREYSRPIFRFTSEYSRYVRMHRKEWPELKNALSGPSSDKVVTTMVACLDAISNAQEAHKQYQYVTDKPDFLSRSAEHDRIAKIIKDQLIMRDIQYNTLHQLVREHE